MQPESLTKLGHFASLVRMSTQADEGRVYEFGIKDRIRAAREGSGMDQEALADAAQLSRQTVSNYERGATKPSRGNVRLIAWATRFDYEWLMTGKVPPTSGDTRTCVASDRPSLRLAA